MVYPDSLKQTVLLLAEQLTQKGLLLATAESCTGGLIAACCTEVSGASHWFERGFVTYTNQAKEACLGVPSATLVNYGAVSEAVARAMAIGTLLHSQAHCSISVTGIAGPTGGSVEKPVGLVWFGAVLRTDTTLASPESWQVHTEKMHFDGDRSQVRMAAVEHAIHVLQKLTS